MTSISLSRTSPPAMTDRQVFRVLFAATYAVFLVAVILRRVGRALAGHDAAPRRSILAETRETGTNTLLFAFMG